MGYTAWTGLHDPVEKAGARSMPFPLRIESYGPYFLQNPFGLTNEQVLFVNARYSGQWDPAWEPLFARQLAGRLWAEEIHDAVAQSSNVVPSYTIANFSAGISPPSIGSFALPTFGRVSSAMQFPETAGDTGR